MKTKNPSRIQMIRHCARSVGVLQGMRHCHAIAQRIFPLNGRIGVLSFLLTRVEGVRRDFVVEGKHAYFRQVLGPDEILLQYHLPLIRCFLGVVFLAMSQNF